MNITFGKEYGIALVSAVGGIIRFMSCPDNDGYQ
jgi:hypothetical protein